MMQSKWQLPAGCDVERKFGVDCVGYYYEPYEIKTELAADMVELNHLAVQYTTENDPDGGVVLYVPVANITPQGAWVPTRH